MEWYDLQIGDILEVNPDLSNKLDCIRCIQLGLHTLYVVRDVVLSDGILHGKHNRISLTVEGHGSLTNIDIGCDGKIIHACSIIRQLPLFKLVSLTEEYNAMERS